MILLEAQRDATNSGVGNERTPSGSEQCPEKGQNRPWGVLMGQSLGLQSKMDWMRGNSATAIGRTSMVYKIVRAIQSTVAGKRKIG